MQVFYSHIQGSVDIIHHWIELWQLMEKFDTMGEGKCMTLIDR
jgi:hypothetical protein